MAICGFLEILGPSIHIHRCLGRLGHFRSQWGSLIQFAISFIAGVSDVGPLRNFMHHSYSITIQKEHANLWKNTPGTRWWRVHNTVINNFRDIDLWIWNIAEFVYIWPLTFHNWVRYWPGIIKKRTSNREHSSRAIRSFFYCLELLHFVWKHEGGCPSLLTPSSTAK